MAPLWTSPQVGNQAAIQLLGLSQDPFSMALPQTAAGIGAVGIDPPPDDLAGITTVDGIFQWLGTEEATRIAFKRQWEARVFRSGIWSMSTKQ